MPRESFATSLAFAPFEIVFSVLAVTVPALAIWIGSSFAAYEGAPIWMPLVAGALLFPILPLAWELVSAARNKGKARWLTGWQRFVLRFLLIDSVFLATLVAAAPQRVFTALSTRGDWILDRQEGEWVAPTRASLFEAVDRLESLHALALGKNTYESDARKTDSTSTAAPTPGQVALAGGPPSLAAPPGPPLPDVPAPSLVEAQPNLPSAEEPAPQPSPSGPIKVGPDGEVLIELDESTQPEPTPVRPASRPVSWPWSARPDPVLASLPPEIASDAAAIGTFFATKIPDRRARLKAVHDFVATRLTYDLEARDSGRLPPQDPATILASGRAVCAGFARLMVEIARAADLDVRFVIGSSREQDGDAMAIDHAWNAAELDGRWYLIDATFDSGAVEDGRFVKRLGTYYFLTPPEIFGVDHFPEDPSWQLRDPALSRAEFLRQPKLSPEFFAHGLGLLAPDRAQVAVSQRFEARISNPRRIFLMARAAPESGAATDCEVVSQEDETRISCLLAAKGRHAFELYGSTQRIGAQPLLGRIDLRNRL
ncbi:MAG: hypothetical protein HYV07_23475 [Deltaproteobacteria bacterium]|nr:hypothetical protein [Deltaproteobacteria bacterium]